jgi:hypothetical protein
MQSALKVDVATASAAVDEVVALGLAMTEEEDRLILTPDGAERYEQIRLDRQPSSSMFSCNVLSWGRLPDQVELARHGHGFGAADSSEFAEDVAHVALDRIKRHDEFVGDLAVAPTHCDQFQNFDLPGGQGFDELTRRRGTSRDDP